VLCGVNRYAGPGSQNYGAHMAFAAVISTIVGVCPVTPGFSLDVASLSSLMQP
jgi:hypothetical protein